MSLKIPNPRFAFHVHKPKARALAHELQNAARQAGFEFKIVTDNRPLAGHVGIFYGINPATYPAFRFYKAEGTAVYLDNGWLSTRQKPTFRFTWNGVQSFLQDMPRAPKDDLRRFEALPQIDRKPERDLALLVLQSPQYFEHLRLGYSRTTWTNATTKLLQMRGYRVQTREKPTKKDPEAETFFEQIARAGIVVSLNSAASLKALRYGIPSYCTLDCTLSPYAPVRIPTLGKAGRPERHEINSLCARLASYEISKEALRHRSALEQMLKVPEDLRRGYFYSQN